MNSKENSKDQPGELAWRLIEANRSLLTAI
jgi:hypothetical protein